MHTKIVCCRRICDIWPSLVRSFVSSIAYAHYSNCWQLTAHTLYKIRITIKYKTQKIKCNITRAKNQQQRRKQNKKRMNEAKSCQPKIKNHILARSETKTKTKYAHTHHGEKSAWFLFLDKNFGSLLWLSFISMRIFLFYFFFFCEKSWYAKQGSSF